MLKEIVYYESRIFTLKHKVWISGIKWIQLLIYSSIMLVDLCD